MRLVGDAVGQRSAVALLVEGREANVFAFEDLGGTSLVIVTRSAAGGAAEDLSQGACHRRLLCDVENYWWCHGWLLPNEHFSFASLDHNIIRAESFFRVRIICVCFHVASATPSFPRKILVETEQLHL